MDRYDEINGLLNAAQGMDADKMLKISADTTEWVVVNGGFARLSTLALNDDGSERYDVDELRDLINEYAPSMLATAETWRARRAIVLDNEEAE